MNGEKAVVTSFLVFFIALTVALFQAIGGSHLLIFLFISLNLLLLLADFGSYMKRFFDVTISSFKRLFRPPVEIDDENEQENDEEKNSGEHHFSLLV